MKTVGQIRRENLERLVEELGTLDKVAVAGESSSVYMSQIRKQTRDKATQRPREMGSAMARRLEVGCSKPAGWMDVDHGPTPGESTSDPSAPRPHQSPLPAIDYAKELALLTDMADVKGDPQAKAVHPYSKTGDRDKLTTNVAAAPALRPSSRVPVVGQVRAGRDGYLEESPYDGEVEYWTGDQQAFALRVSGDSMHPRYRAGEFVIVSPNVAPLPGVDVVISLKCGRKLLKQLNWIRGDEFQLLSINGDYAPETLLVAEIVSMHKVLGSVGADALLKS